MSLCAIPNLCPDMQVSVLLVLLHQVAISNRMAGFCYTQFCKLTSRRFPSACSPQRFLTSTFSRVTATEFVTWNFCVIRVSLTLSRWCRCICRTMRIYIEKAAIKTKILSKGRLFICERWNLTTCWRIVEAKPDSPRSFWLTFMGSFFFSFFAVRCWMWPSRTSSWGLWSQPAPDLACPKLSRCFDRFLRASCVWKWPSAIRFLTHSHQTVFFWWFRLGAPFHCIWLAHLWHLFSIRFTYVSQCCSQALPLGTVREVLDVPLQDWVLERFDIHNEVQIDSWNLVTFTMTHVQPGVEIYLTWGKAKCFVSTCGVAADNMRTSQASSMIVFASALVLTFCVAFSSLFFSSLPFFVGDFFSCFFLLQVNLRAANRLGWQGKDGEKPFVGMRLCSNHRRLACWPYTEHKRTIERQAINMYASCLFFFVRQVQTVAWGGVHPQFSLSLSLSVWPSCRRVGWNAPQQRRKRRPGRTRKLRCRLSWHVFSCVFFFGEFDPLWGCRPVKASRPDDGGQAEEGSSGADWVGMFSAPFFGGGEFDLLRGCRRVEGQSEGDSCLYIPFALAALRPSIEAAVKAKAKTTARGMCVLAFSSLVLVFVF